MRSEQGTLFGDNPDYEDFKAKFKPKLTTDDCYTPMPVYDAVAAWVAQEYSVPRERMVRPFWPGGNFQSFDYSGDAVVVDNPPFSIIAEIIRWYCARGVTFFLFAPALTLFTATEQAVCYIPCGVTITYENGAKVPTSFVTNLDPMQVRTAPDLYRAVDDATTRVQRKGKVKLPSYDYPDEVITAAMVQRWCKYGVDYKLPRACSTYIGALDMQRSYKKAIFWGGYLLSTRAAAERAAAERAAEENAAVARWRLSPREERIVAALDSGDYALTDAGGTAYEEPLDGQLTLTEGEQHEDDGREGRAEAGRGGAGGD